MSYKVSAKRHLGKTISYRIISTFVGFLIMWYMTGSIKFGAAFGVTELILKPVIYYFHERIWYRRIKFGLVVNNEKKKKVTELTEVEVKSPPKIYEDEAPKTTPPPKKSEKKVLNYSTNR